MRRSFFIVASCLALALHAQQPGPADPVWLDGAFHSTGDDAARRTGSVRGMIWDSNQPDGSGQGRLQLSLPAAPAVLRLNVTGFVDNSTLRLSLQSPLSLTPLRLSLRSNPGPQWCLYSWDLPAGWVGRPVLLVAEDNSPELWLGLGIPATDAPARSAHWSAIRTSVAAVLLTLVPFFSALVLLRPRCGRDQPLLVTLALVASGVFAMAVFFGFFFATKLGLSVLFAGLVAGVWAAGRVFRERLWRQPHLMPLVAVLSLTALVISTLYLYGGDQSPEGVPAGRHDLKLPVDNAIPEIFADKIYHHAPLHPFLADWLTSDRPPLQSGYLLISRPFVASPAGRIAAAVTCQLAAYAGLWVLFAALGVPRRWARLCLLACVTSGFFLLNTLFTWPKLLPAGFLLAAAGLLYRSGRDGRRAGPAEIFAVGGCAALAMLAHGGSFFGLCALGIVHAFRGGCRDRRLILGAAAIGLLLYAPWLAYQHWADPPGDRLLKYHLANHPALDPRGALTVIAEAYHQAPGLEILRNKWSNVRVLVGDFSELIPNLGATIVQLATGQWPQAWWRFSTTVQGGAFFHLLQSLDFLIAGLPFLWLARFRPQAQAAIYCTQVALASIVVWCVLMFGPESTVIHQGTYLTGSLLHVAAVLGLLLSGRPQLVRTVFGLHLALWLGLWVLSPAWNAQYELLRPAWVPFWGLVFFAAALGLVWSGLRLAVGREDEPEAVPDRTG